MSNSEVVAARHEEFSSKLQVLLNEYKDAIAPDIEGNEICDHEGDCPCTVPPNLMADEWFIIVNWADFDTGQQYVTGVSPTNQRESHTLGLIYWYKAKRGW